MPILYSKTKQSLFFRRYLVSVILFGMLLTSVPLSVFADDTELVAEPVPVSDETDVVEDDTATSSESMTGDDEPVVIEEAPDTATSTEDTTATSSDETASSTDDTAGADGEPGADGSVFDENASTTDEAATSTPGDTATSTTAGTEGQDGDSGDEPDNTLDEEAEGEPIPVVLENDIGEDSSPEDGEGVTGDILQTGRNVTIETGEAVAQAELSNDVNSNVVMSEYEEDMPSDLDIYTFNATGSNYANVSSDGAAFALTGDNRALSTGVAEIDTGNARAALNIANVVNTNVVDSEGYLYLKNQMLEPHQTLDLHDLFFPDDNSLLADATNCTLLSCMAEDIVYNFSQSNEAHVVNDAYIEATTGDNKADGDQLRIETGDAYGAANVINVVNTNIVDSNYRFLTLNALGDLDGDLILPTNELFTAFFGRPNGLAHTVEQEGADSVHVDVLHDNDATVENNLDTYAETGLNEQYTSFDSTITTGQAESESNVLNKINQNIYGGDNLYLLIRVHGYWSGDVVGLPDGLAWDWTPDGIIIYNEDAEIVPSEILPYDVDSYTANISDVSTTSIENNINIDAVSGRNEIDGVIGEIDTGDAFASANVMNIANSNIVGTNFSFAVVNIFGDFDGDVTFSSVDLTLAGTVSSNDDPLLPGSELTYTYTIANSSDKVATDVTLRQTLNNAYAGGTNNQQIASLGTLAPGESTTVTLNATVRDDLAYGDYDVVATATVESNEAEGNGLDNIDLITNSFSFVDPNATDNTDATSTATTTDTTDDNTASTTSDTETGDGDDTGSDETNIEPAVTTESVNRSGGGGGGGSSRDDDEEEEAIDPTSAPFLVITKEADVPESHVVTAGEEVEYTITVENRGGIAYDAVVYDTLRNPIDSVISEQSWELGTILPGEIIDIEYVTEYNFQTPSGEYTNTASVEAYRHEDTKVEGGSPLKLDTAKHVVTITGVDLAVGNVGVIAYFPAGNGTVGALVTWETSKPSVSQVFYGSQAGSPYNELLPRYGFPYQSFKFAEPKTKHLMIISNLLPGTTYSYKIDAENGTYDALSREYTFAVPAVVARLLVPGLNYGVSRVAGASVSTPVTPASPTPVTPAPTYIAPTPSYVPPKPAVESPEPDPTPEPEPATESNDDSQASSSGGVGGFVKKIFGVFR